MTEEKPVEFSLNFKPEHDWIVFDAEKFNQLIKQDLPWLDSLPEGSPESPPEKAIRLGQFKLFNAKFPRFSMRSRFFADPPKLTRNWLDMRYRSKTFNVSFSDDVMFPLLQDQHLQAWMSITPNELMTQKGQINRTRGVTVVAGMGLGWFVAQALKRDKVKKVIVVDNDANVLNFIGEKLQKQYDKPLELVHADAYDFDWDQPFDSAVWDIWRTFSECAWDRKYIELKKKIESQGKSCTQWGSMTRG